MATITIPLESSDTNQLGSEMYDLISQLYPICRSITGDGVRKSLRLLQRYLPLEIHEVATGTPVFDWIVPKEWNIRDAYVANSNGERIIDFQRSNLHILNYSIPIHRRMPLSELKEHLFSIPDHPDWIPYRTSYYKENWGFCLSHNQLQALDNKEEYEVFIDSSLEDGHLTYGEYYLPGEIEDEVLFSCHICHPSLCNDNLSGVALSAFLANHLKDLPKRYSYRFLFIPGTIGSITWLGLNENKIHRIKHGLVVSGVGDSGRITYKKSRRGDAEIDKAVIHVLSSKIQDYKVEEFSPYGYDERQYCSPGFNLPIGRLTRTPFGQYPEYHTSADNLNFVKSNSLSESLATYLAVVDVLEHNQSYLNTNPKCEPQLGKRGLYGTMGGKQTTKADEMAMLWVLNLSDGDHSLLDIAERANLSFVMIKQAANSLLKSGLLEKCLQ
jgi:aminopeptidase-like protein